MNEIALRNRKRKKASKGKPIRVSDLVYNTLNSQRLNKRSLSWDAFMRIILGLPNRKGEVKPLLEGWLEVNSGQFYLNEKDANGAAVVLMAKKKTKKYLKPIRMREVI